MSWSNAMICYSNFTTFTIILSMFWIGFNIGHDLYLVICGMHISLIQKISSLIFMNKYDWIVTKNLNLQFYNYVLFFLDFMQVINTGALKYKLQYNNNITCSLDYLHFTKHVHFNGMLCYGECRDILLGLHLTYKSNWKDQSGQNCFILIS